MDQLKKFTSVLGRKVPDSEVHDAKVASALRRYLPPTSKEESIGAKKKLNQKTELRRQDFFSTFIARSVETRLDEGTAEE